MEYSNRPHCSKCNCRRDDIDFEVNSMGNRKKLCFRHGKNRDPADTFDIWESFIRDLVIWSQSVSLRRHFHHEFHPDVCMCSKDSNTIERDLLFSLDDLPVSFGGRLLATSDEQVDREGLNQAVKNLVNIIWQQGKFRFILHTVKARRVMQYAYICSQDRDHEQKTRSIGKRDVGRMERFSCKSNLSLWPDLGARTLRLVLRHHRHEIYQNVQSPSEVAEFVAARSSLTASEIYRELLAAHVPGSEQVTQGQVYYMWQQGNAAQWRRDPDQFLSAEKLLLEGQYQSRRFDVDGADALAVFIDPVIRQLTEQAKELVMDATFGTNNAGLDLYAILAELDGTGVPLAYCFARRGQSAAPRATSVILQQFLGYLRDAGMHPTFFGLDKDFSEIRAVRQVWPAARIQLCFWHVKRAIRTKMASSNRVNAAVTYHPAEALELVSELEVCWGSLLTRRPDGFHRQGTCNCVSRRESFEEVGRCEPCTPEERNTVLDIVSRHFNAHSAIPDKNGTFRDVDTIHRECATEMYRWCRHRNYFRLWMYLFVNWYRQSQWALWARSVDAEHIPVLKTTMIVEAHWRRIKHDYLHRHNRPRVDLVLWVLTTRVIPDAIRKMTGLLQGVRRMAFASWRKAFKRDWKQLESRIIASDWNQYHTNPVKWTCACDYFLQSRFLICKHIISCFQPIADPWSFIGTVRRRRSPPFWVDDQLILLPLWRNLSENAAPLDDNSHTVCDLSESAAGDITENNSDAHSITSSSSENLSEGDNEIEMISGARDIHTQTAETQWAGQSTAAMTLLADQTEKGNWEFVQRFLTSNISVLVLLEEIAHLRAQRHMPATWTRYRHPATMYYR